LYIFQLAAINGLRGYVGMNQVFHPHAIYGKPVVGPFELQGNRWYRQPNFSGTSVER
jgi:hypothetical protein